MNTALCGRREIGEFICCEMISWSRQGSLEAGKLGWGAGGGWGWGMCGCFGRRGIDRIKTAASLNELEHQAT